MAKTVLFTLLSLIRVVNSDPEEGHSLMIKVSPFFTKSKSFKAAAADTRRNTRYSFGDDFGMSYFLLISKY